MGEKERDSTGRNNGTVFTFYKDIQNELDNHFTKALSLPTPDTTAASHSSPSLLSSKPTQCRYLPGDGPYTQPTDLVCSSSLVNEICLQ